MTDNPSVHCFHRMVQVVCALLDNAGQRAIASYGLGLSQFTLFMLVAETERSHLTTLSDAVLVSRGPSPGLLNNRKMQETSSVYPIPMTVVRSMSC